ncbi:MAG: radical SAM protein [Candidatus Diapherotrites archaeon]
MEWPLTFACNNECISCIFDLRQTKNIGTPFLKEIKNVIDGAPEGETLCLTGGEPTLRKDFIEIARYALEKKAERTAFHCLERKAVFKKKFY